MGDAAEQARTSSPDKARFWLLTAGLVTTLILWVVHAVGQVRGWWDVPFWKVWEVSSLGVTLLVTVSYWSTYIVGRKDKEAGLDGGKLTDIAFWVIALIFFAVGFGCAAIVAWNEGPVKHHVGLLVVGALAAVVLARCELCAIHTALGKLGALLPNKNGEQKDEIIKKGRIKLGDRDNVSKLLCFSDCPIAFAMIVLAVFALWYDYCCFDRVLYEVRALPDFPDGRHIPHGTVAKVERHMGLEQLRAAIAGAVALQLLYSNAVFWLVAFADMNCGKSCLTRLSPAMQPIRVVLRPHESWSDEDIAEELTRIAVQSSA